MFRKQVFAEFAAILRNIFDILKRSVCMTISPSVKTEKLKDRHILVREFLPVNNSKKPK